jgi:dihydroorotate dehydrogenase electron transfer subunit
MSARFSLRIVRILRKVHESSTVTTLHFQDKLCGKAVAGQFVMVWIPGVDEIPLSLSSITKTGQTAITVARVGEATQAIQGKEPGDLLGIRGPFGNGFALTNGEVIIVAGGTGLAPLTPLTERLVGNSNKITFLLGAKTQKDLFFVDRLRLVLSQGKSSLSITTEDGSYGDKGLITDLVKRTLERTDFVMMYICGPEPMMAKVFTLAEKFGVPVQASVERIMRCAIGLCGSCAVGKYRVCQDGPVLTSEQLREVQHEFGVFTRRLNGKRMKF